jgi:LmbE family N-acetylglucosaminyl deacetylase
MSKVIVISAHPDDETLGVGGTLLKHKFNGDKLFWLNATKLDKGDLNLNKRVEKREKEIQEVIKKFGFEEFIQLDYITTKLNSESKLLMIPKISQIFSRIKPEIVYVVNRSDSHSDHRYLFEAVFSASKTFRQPSIKKILMYECISETEFSAPLTENIFIPNYFVDITPFLEEKLKILNIYTSEISDPPFPRSAENIRALATLRGSTAGVMAAEAFHSLKIIDK